MTNTQFIPTVDLAEAQLAQSCYAIEAMKSDIPLNACIGCKSLSIYTELLG